MESAETLPPPVGRQRAHRSAASNGSRLFAVQGIDGRTQTMRRFRDLVEGIEADLGGNDLLSEGQKQLVRRAAGLAVMAEGIEADLVRDMAFDPEQYGILADRLGRCLQRLGLKRVARDATNLRDYIDAKARPVTPASEAVQSVEIEEEVADAEGL